MNEKVILILVDGMRPDSLTQCGNPFVAEFTAQSRCINDATTVMPSVTLPCHMSLFHSVLPERHGILSNTYVPQVRPIDGLIEVLDSQQKSCAMFYNWEPLRDISRPKHLQESHYVGKATYDFADEKVTDTALASLQKNEWDFAFIYLGGTDETGHKHGWMSNEYLQAVHTAWDCIKRLHTLFADKYTMIVTADHGGHDRTHGTDMAEDMTIPIFLRTRQDVKLREKGNIIDIAPTIAALMDVQVPSDWDGAKLF